jgi:diaminohydroxyphosphoribosylaminopyrimidine deaminase/5-amino-6-(5-phosphoribosylamino)uracil reductase
VLTLPAPNGCLELPALMRELGAREVVSLMVEAGGNFSGALLAAGLVHKLRLYLAPLLIGGQQAVPVLGDPGWAHLADAPRLHRISYRRVGEDLRIEGYLAVPAEGNTASEAVS